MCGIAGLQLKNPDLYAQLGTLVVPMLDVLASRGPDSAGVAIYRRDVPPGELKYSLCAPTPGYDWAGYVSALEAAAGAVPVEFRARGRDGVIVTAIGPDRGPDLLAGIDPSVRLFGYGSAIEVYKDVGPAAEVCDRYGVTGMGGYQAIGHTMMATESAVSATTIGLQANESRTIASDCPAATSSVKNPSNTFITPRRASGRSAPAAISLAMYRAATSESLSVSKRIPSAASRLRTLA